MNRPASEIDSIMEQLVDAQGIGWADDFILRRAQKVAGSVPPPIRHHTLGMVAALRFDEQEAMRHFDVAVQLAPGEFAPAWNRASTAVMFGRWDRALEAAEKLAGEFDDQRVKALLVRMLQFRGRFKEAARLSGEAVDQGLALIARSRGLDPVRVAAWLDKAGEFLRARSVPALESDMRILDADEELIEVSIATPTGCVLDADFVDWLSQYDPVPEESCIIIGFDEKDGNALARTA